MSKKKKSWIWIGSAPELDSGAFDTPDPTLLLELGDLSPKEVEEPNLPPAPPANFSLQLGDLEPVPEKEKILPSVNPSFEPDLGVGLWTVMDNGPIGNDLSKKRYRIVPIDHETVVENKKRKIPGPGIMTDGAGVSYLEAKRIAKNLEELSKIMNS